MSFFSRSKRMKHINSAIFLIAFLFLTSISAFAQESELKVVDEVVAQVNDGVITLSRVRREMNTVIDAMVAEGKTREEATATVQAKQGELIANIINEELLLQKGKELGVEADADSAVNQRLVEIMRQQNYKSLDVLYDAMTKQGVDPQQIRDTWRRQFIKDIVMQREVDGKTYWSWSSKEIKAYYEKHKEKFTKPETLSLSEIFLSFAGRDENAIRDKAKILVTQLRGGADFAKTAIENSDRQDVKDTKGSVGVISVPQLKELNEKFVTAVAATKVGGVSEPVETVEGIEIFRVDERKEASKDAFFDEAEVRKAMTYEVIPAERKKYLVSLRGESYIKVNDTYRPLVSPILSAEAKPEEKKPTK
ncbi:MAG TPA: peptidyl-prolyl cis-trans isomerase [Pyrinomonadaceae bacterium]|nr:peptidyl-prolyl cis-trans isomerase [Pyrinomonadaceae bacterium]